MKQNWNENWNDFFVFSESLYSRAALLRNKYETFLFTKDDLQMCGIFDIFNDVFETNCNGILIIYEMTFINYFDFTYF